MSENNKPDITAKTVSPIASLKWFEHTLMILKNSFWPFFSFTLITLLAIQLAFTLTAVMGIFALLIVCAINFLFTASIAKNSALVQRSKRIKLTNMFKMNTFNIKQFIILAIVYFCALFSLLIVAISPNPDVFEILAKLENQTIELQLNQKLDFLNTHLLNHPEEFSKIATFLFIILTGSILLESLFFFAPILLALHSDLNAFQAIKMSATGTFKNIIAFIVFAIILMPLLFILPLILNIFGIAIFILIVKISSFVAYQELFLDNSNNDSNNDDHTHLNELDSREF